MIELKDLTLEKRVEISIQCKGFFIHTYKPKAAYPFFEILKRDLGLGSRYDSEVWCLLTCINKALGAGCTGSHFPLKSNHYKTANEITKQNLSARRMCKVLETADHKGWITLYKGYWYHKYDNMQSCIILSETSLKVFSTTISGKFTESLGDREVVEIRDQETKEPIMKLTRFKGISEHRKLMTRYNRLLKSFEIKMGDIQCYVAYKQIFSKDLTLAGRIYSYGGFQNSRKELRPFITIDDEATTEVDIRGIHPSICRLLQGCKAVDESFDPYGVSSKGVFETIPQKEFRLLCKFGVMMMINCKSHKGASEALNNLVKKDNSFENKVLSNCIHLTNSDYYTLIELLIKHNNPVKFFGKDSYSWDTLQRYDSRVCEGVIKSFIDKGKCVLCWHDSWVCKRSDREFLIECIKESWYEVFNTEDNLFLKVEF
jgi:hypothetical protein